MGSESRDDAGGPIGSWFTAIRDSLSGRQYDPTSGSLSRAIVLLAVPMVLEMAMESVFAVCDVFFVSRLGDDAVAVVGLSEALLTIVYAIGIGLSMGVTALVARRIGERNVAGAVRAATQAVVLGVLIGIALGVPCYLFADSLLRMMGATAEVVALGHGYTSILLGGNVVIVLLFLCNAVFRGAGDPALAMRALWIANAINLVLDPCLIFGLGPFPELGVTGAAVATTLGRGTGVVYQLVMLRRGAGRVVLRGPACRIEPRVMLELLRLSAGGLLQFLIGTASWVMLMRIVAPFGDAAVAGYTIAVRIVIFALLPSWGVANAAATLVGQNLGAGQPWRAEQAVWRSGLINTVFLGSVTVIFLIAAPGLVGIFTDQPATHQVAVSALRTMSAGYVFYAWGMVMVQAFNGAGDTMTPTRINLVCFWCFQIPLAHVLATGAGLGPQGVFLSVALAESLLAILAVIWFRRGRWKLAQVAADVAA